MISFLGMKGRSRKRSGEKRVISKYDAWAACGSDAMLKKLSGKGAVQVREAAWIVGINYNK